MRKREHTKGMKKFIEKMFDDSEMKEIIKVDKPKTKSHGDTQPNI